MRRFQRTNGDWDTLPDKVAVQLNDTHPALAVPELLRILLDEAHLEWDRAWDLVQRTLAYTNHTLLPEALEKGPLEWFESSCPGTARSSSRSIAGCSMTCAAAFRRPRTRLAHESDRGGRVKRVRMANLAIVGSHSTNGVAAIHSALLRSTTVRDLSEVFPDRFNNKTNGVTPRRWLLLANPGLAETITGAIGDGWITDLRELARLKPYAEDPASAMPLAPRSDRPSRRSPTGSDPLPARASIPKRSSTAR